MKKLIPLLVSVACLSASAQPLYEPFTEYAPTIAGFGTNALDLSLGGQLYASGLPWTNSLKFAGTSGTLGIGVDIFVTNTTVANSAFTPANLSSILPSTFPGYPAGGSAITNFSYNPLQAANSANLVGNSAVLPLPNKVVRPASGTRTLFFSYLFNVIQQGQLGTGNEGRYLILVSATNLVEGKGWAFGPAYTNWNDMFNTYNGTAAGGVHYASQGLLSKTAGTSYYIGGCDSGAGKNWSASPLSASYGTPVFVIGEYVLNASGSDQNIMWVNPALSAFGGSTVPAGQQTWVMTNFFMPDISGFVIQDRPGSGVAGGVGTNFIANLIIGTTWSYVTGGPEFTNQPAANTSVTIGGSFSLTADAVAAGQSVSYQWVKITGGVTNNVTNGAGGAGGSGTVSGATTHNLTVTGLSASDTGHFQLVATASGTSFTLNSSDALVQPDPVVAANPTNATVNFGQSASFTATVTTGNAPLNYRWYLGSTPLNNGAQPGGSTASNAQGTTGAGSSFNLTLTLNNVNYHDIGNYQLWVTNTQNVPNSSAAASLYVVDPFIVTPPSNPGVVAGGNAHFSVVANGSATVSYQWYEGATALFNGGTTATGSATVSGADTANLTLTGVQDADNGTYYCAVSGSGSGQTTNSPSAVLVVQDPLTITSTPMSLVERAGEHVAFAVGVTGGGPTFVWTLNGNLIPGATGNSVVRTNIQTATDAGTYSVTVSNLATAGQTFMATLNVVNSSVLVMSPTNLVVARVGDGAQTLSQAAGNTLYLDQYHVNGAYVNSSQIPDERTGQPYGAGGTASTVGSPALIVAGSGADAPYEAMLTSSSINQQYLAFAGYALAYPFGGADATAEPGGNGGNIWRGEATMNAYGLYSLTYTNTGLYSGGSHFNRGMATLDGTNLWTIGSAGSGTVKYVNASPVGSAYANGGGIPSSGNVSAGGGRSIQVVNGPLPVAGYSSVSNLVFSDSANVLGAGLYAVSGTPEPSANNNINFANLLTTGGSAPGDFAFSPDCQTLYVADAGTFTSTSDQAGGGIQRFDWNGSAYTYAYTLQPLSTSTAGAQGMVVDFSANNTWGPSVTGAKIYATTFGASGNSLIAVTDIGAGSPASTVLATAGANQGLRGVRFGPAAIPPAVYAFTPASQIIPQGSPATFTVSPSGSAPFSYQWSFNGGAGAVAIAGATSSSFTTNNVSFGSAGTYSVVVSNLTGQTISASGVLTVTAGAPTIGALPNYRETVGDHMAWGPNITGTQPWTNYWYKGATLLQSNVTPNANGSLALTNIQLGDSGSYILRVTNFYGSISATGTLTVTSTKQILTATNIVVARIGDGAQALSSVTGNTIYLDQYTPAGSLTNTIQVTDQATGQPYYTGAPDSAASTPAMLLAGAGLDSPYEGFLSLAPNSETICFCGYCQAYPFPGPDVSVIGGGTVNWHGIGGVDTYGYYTLFYTNTGLYSAGGHQTHGAVDTGSSTNFYSTGQASQSGVKFLDIAFEPASGGGIQNIGGSGQGTRAIHIVSGNLVFSDANGASGSGIYAIAGLPTTVSTPALQLADPSSPMDFAASPDAGNLTVYVADNAAFTGTGNQAGGIQRYDSNGAGGYNYSYTLGTGSGSTVGARGLTVDFSAHGAWGSGVQGAVLYATTAEASGNRFIKIVDNGASSAATVVATASPGQMLAGVSFGPSIVAPGFAVQPQNQSVFAGQAATFSSQVVGSGPFTYQWFFQANCTGAFNPINHATNSSLTIAPAANGNAGCYYVVATSPGNQTVQSSTVTLTVTPPPRFISEAFNTPPNGGGLVLNFTGPASQGYSLWTSTDLTLRPVQTTWQLLTTGTFSGGTDSFTDPSAGPGVQHYYIITMP